MNLTREANANADGDAPEENKEKKLLKKEMKPFT